MNKVRSQSGGFTIVETMIVIAVTGMMFLSAMIFISGQQAKTEFTQAAHETEAKINDVLNDVSTGVYNNKGDFSCDYVGGAPGNGIIITPGAKAQGANGDCIFIGKVIQFAPNSAKDRLRIYSIAGQRQNISGQEVQSILDAKAKTLANGNGGLGRDEYEDFDLPYGLTVGNVTYSNGRPTGGMGVFTQFGSYSTPGTLKSGSTNTDLVAFNGLVNQLGPDFVDQVNTALQDPAALPTSYTKNPTDGITICFRSGGTDQHATMVVGGNNRQAAAPMLIDSGNCP
ncbi:MAG TPA: hypothetical protein VLF87_00465 [Patescibacteria group bacterium]|nr:hypothetical protein [Patescibacteria group bacterium]